VDPLTPVPPYRLFASDHYAATALRPLSCPSLVTNVHRVASDPRSRAVMGLTHFPCAIPRVDLTDFALRRKGFQDFRGLAGAS
jgi:hypothetical protein